MPSWPRRPGACRGCGERSAAPLKQEAKNPRQEACLSPPPPLLHGLRLRCRRHSRSAPAAALLCPGVGDFPPDLLRLLLPEDHPSPSLPPYPQRKVRTFPGWDPLWVVSQGVYSPEDRRDRGWAQGIFRLERKKAKSSVAEPVALRAPAGPIRCEWLCPTRLSQFPPRMQLAQLAAGARVLHTK